MIQSSFSLESDVQIETPHEGSGYDEDPEPEPESKESGNDYLDDLYDSNSDEDEDGKVNDASDGKIVVVTEKSKDGNDYMDLHGFGRSDPDPPSVDGLEDEPFANLKEGEKGKDYQDFMLWKH